LQSYEGGFVLWPSLVYGLKSLGLNPVVAGQWLHLGVSVLLLGIIFYGIPRLPLIIKVLVGSSYLLMYMYTAITRVYGASALLLGIFIMLELRSQRHILWKALAIFFLALSSSPGLVLAVALAVYLFTKSSLERLRTRAIGAGIVAAGIILSIVMAVPPPDTVEVGWPREYRASVLDSFVVPRLLSTSTNILLNGFLFIPIVTSLHWWQRGDDTTFHSLLSIPLSDQSIVSDTLIYFIGLIVIALAVWLLWCLSRISKPIALAMATLWGGNLLAWSVMHPGYPRHLGIMVLGTLAFFALARSRNTKFPLRWMVIFTSVILVLQSTSGFWAVYAERRDTFSQSKNLAQWLEVNHPQETPFVYPDHVGTGICVYNGGYVYSLTTGKKISFVQQWGDYLKPFSAELFSRLNLEGEGCLLITFFPFHAILDGGRIVVEPLQSFQPAVALHESAWVHRVHLGKEGEGDREKWTYQRLAFKDQFLRIKTVGRTDKQRLPLEGAKFDFDNEVGSTTEVKVRILQAPSSGWDGAMFSLLDGKREGKIRFFANRIDIGERNGLKTMHFMNTRDTFHAYRITIVRDLMKVYVDGKEVASVVLTDQVEGREILFGDFSNKEWENMDAQIEYLAYFTGGALQPDGEPVITQTGM